MNWKTAVLGLVIIDFAALTGYAILEVGYIGILEGGLANWGATQIFVDLIIACTLAMIWMVRDARQRSLNPWPYVAITLAGGSFGPLLYLLRREWGANRADAGALQPGVS